VVPESESGDSAEEQPETESDMGQLEEGGSAEPESVDESEAGEHTDESEVVQEEQEPQPESTESTDGTESTEGMEEPQEETTQPILPVITSESNVVELVRHEDVSLCMQILLNPNTGVSGGCDIYLVDRKSGLPMLDGGGENLHLKKSRLCSATDEKVLNCIGDLEENFSIDEKKQAFERAKLFLEVSKSRTPIKTSMSFEETYSCLTQYIIEGEAIEKLDDNLMADQRKFLFDEEAGVVGVRDNYFQHALDDICSGYSQRGFLKSLKMVEAHLGTTLEISNNGRHGWGTTQKGKFMRFYRFKVMDLSTLCKEETA
jgi:hypothetical protein